MRKLRIEEIMDNEQELLYYKAPHIKPYLHFSMYNPMLYW